MPLEMIDSRFNDTRITDSSGNVFVDLGFDAAEASVMALRVELMVQLRDQLHKQGLTQAQAAKQLGVTQPRVSALLKGVWKDFSVDMLLTLASRLGMQPRLVLAV
jgi:predicted XRE-type DNA-binding protein